MTVTTADRDLSGNPILADEPLYTLTTHSPYGDSAPSGAQTAPRASGGRGR